MLDAIEGPSDWKKQQEAVKAKLAGIAKKSGSEIAKKISSRKEAGSDKKVSQNCDIIQTLCSESCDQLRSGDMTLKEVVKDLCEALEAMASMKDDETKEGTNE